MGLLKNFINDLYAGIYLHSLKHESIQAAKNAVGFRMMATLFLYYFSLEIILLSVYVRISGRFNLSVVGAAFLIFGLYFLIYSNLVNPLIEKDNLGESMDLDSKNQLITKSNRTLIFGIAFLFISFYIVTLIQRSKS